MLPTAEDLDAFFRVLRSGHKIVYEPAAAIRHDHPATWAGLRRHMYDWGFGYIGYLLHIAVRDPAYRRAALVDILNWFSYQARQRAWPQRQGTDPFPLELTLRELYGGMAALGGFWICLWRAHLKEIRARRRRVAAAPAPAPGPLPVPPPTDGA